MVEAPEAPHTPFMHPVPRGVYQVETPQEPSPLKDHLHAKFCPDRSSRLDFYREHTDTQTDIALYVLDGGLKFSQTKYCKNISYGNAKTDFGMFCL